MAAVLGSFSILDWLKRNWQALFSASVAQLIEQGFCKAQVVGLNPSAGSIPPPVLLTPSLTPDFAILPPLFDPFKARI